MADIGIDLGTATVIVYDSEKGIMLKEPSVVAVNTATGNVLEVGEAAYKMIGRTPDRIRAIRPLSDGVVSDFDTTEQMLKYFLKKVCGGTVVKPRVVICVPSGITGVESRACVNAAVSAGARKVYLIEEPVAAALGAGLDISKPMGHMILDIGGGTSDIAVLSLNGIVCKTSLKMAGNKFDQAIIKYLRTHKNVLVGEKMAEKIKMGVASVCFEPEEEVTIEAKGRNLLTGLPQRFEVSRSELYEVLLEPVMQIVTALHQILEGTPPELAGDIFTNGLLMTGGGSMLHGLDRLITQKVKIPARLAENPVDCVAIGTGRSFTLLDTLYDGFVSSSTHTH